jgi:hypothetical protein
MYKIRPSTFLTGFLIALMMAVIFWYYQKSTSAEDGALDLLDRYAQARARIGELESELVSHAPGSGRANDAG